MRPETPWVNAFMAGKTLNPQDLSLLFLMSYMASPVDLVWIKQAPRVLFYFFSFRIIPVFVASQIFSSSGAARNVRNASAR